MTFVLIITNCVVTCSKLANLQAGVVQETKTDKETKWERDQVVQLDIFNEKYINAINNLKDWLNLYVSLVLYMKQLLFTHSVLFAHFYAFFGSLNGEYFSALSSLLFAIERFQRFQSFIKGKIDKVYNSALQRPERCATVTWRHSMLPWIPWFTPISYRVKSTTPDNGVRLSSTLTFFYITQNMSGSRNWSCNFSISREFLPHSCHRKALDFVSLLPTLRMHNFCKCYTTTV